MTRDMVSFSILEATQTKETNLTGWYFGPLDTQQTNKRRRTSREEKEDGNSNGTKKMDGIRGREFQILKILPKTRRRLLAKRARNSFRVRGNSETPAIAVAAVDSVPRHAAPLQKHAINYPGIAASTIPSMLHKW